MLTKLVNWKCIRSHGTFIFYFIRNTYLYRMATGFQKKTNLNFLYANILMISFLEIKVMFELHVK
jgi:hypothetical protein